MKTFDLRLIGRSLFIHMLLRRHLCEPHFGQEKCEEEGDRYAGDPQQFQGKGRAGMLSYGSEQQASSRPQAICYLSKANYAPAHGIGDMALDQRGIDCHEGGDHASRYEQKDQ